MSTDVYIHGVDSIKVEYTDFEELKFTTCDMTISQGNAETVVKMFLPWQVRLDFSTTQTGTVIAPAQSEDNLNSQKGNKDED